MVRCAACRPRIDSWALCVCFRTTITDRLCCKLGRTKKKHCQKRPAVVQPAPQSTFAPVATISRGRCVKHVLEASVQDAHLLHCVGGMARAADRSCRQCDTNLAVLGVLAGQCGRQQDVRLSVSTGCRGDAGAAPARPPAACGSGARASAPIRASPARVRAVAKSLNVWPCATGVLFKWSSFSGCGSHARVI